MLESQLSSQEQGNEAVLAEPVAPPVSLPPETATSQVTMDSVESVAGLFSMRRDSISDSDVFFPTPLVDFTGFPDLSLVPEPPITPPTTCSSTQSFSIPELTQSEL